MNERKRNYDDEKKNEEMREWLKYTVVGVSVLILCLIFLFIL